MRITIQVRRAVITFLCFLFVSNITISQVVPVPESLKTVPNANCYWSYSVERLGTINDSLHKYQIKVQLEQQDSSGNNRGRLRVRHALIYCAFIEKDIPKKIYCKQVGKQWIANFSIFTNKPLPVEIIADYNNQKRTMPLTLNEGTYPGEPDNY